LGFPGFDPIPPRDDFDFDYDRRSPPLTELFVEMCDRNATSLDRAMGDDLRRVDEILDGLYRLMGYYLPNFGGWAGAAVNPSTQILFPCFHKGLISLATASSLTKRGLYGPARPLLRHAFESAVIGKFCAVHHESTVFDKWMDGYEVWLGREVLPAILRPTPDALKRLWSELSSFTHSTVYAGQVSLRMTDSDDVKAVWLNLALVAVLSQCLYHLLSTHMATSSVRWYLSYYGDGEGAKAVAAVTKKEMQEFSRRRLSPEARKVVTEFRARWSVAEMSAAVPPANSPQQATVRPFATSRRLSDRSR
jgi:hypothetical protein